MSADSCPTCGANVPAESRFCPECGAPAIGPDGVETRLRKYWSAPDAGLLAGIALAGVGILLVGIQVWLWGILVLVLAAAVLVLRSKAGRRGTGVALGAASARLTAHRRVVGARSHGQLELFRLRRELAELQSERSRGYHELGRATHAGDEAEADAAKAQLDDVGLRIVAKEAEIGALVGQMEERVRRAQAEVTPTEPLPEPVPESAPDDPAPDPEPPPEPETEPRSPSSASNA